MDIGTIKETVDALGKALELSVKVLEEEQYEFPRLLEALTSGAAVFPWAGIIFSMVESFLTKQNHEEIMNAFKGLHRSIIGVRDDVKELQAEIKWVITTLSYQECVSRIELAMEYTYEIGHSGQDFEKRRRYQKRLLEMNRTQELTLALRMLDGITGEKDFFRNQILEQFYDKSKGTDLKLMLLSARLLQLVIGGIMSLMTWEALENGPDGPRDLQGNYGKRLEDVVLAIESLLDCCVSKAEHNMYLEITDIIANNSSESCAEIAKVMFNSLTLKYDWLRFRCFVYHDSNKAATIPITTNGSFIEAHLRGKRGEVHYFRKGCASTYNDKEQIEKQIIAAAKPTDLYSSLRDDFRLGFDAWIMSEFQSVGKTTEAIMVNFEYTRDICRLLAHSHIKWWTLVSMFSVPSGMVIYSYYGADEKYIDGKKYFALLL